MMVSTNTMEYNTGMPGTPLVYRE